MYLKFRYKLFGVSTSKPEKGTLSKGACPSNVFIRLLRRIESKAVYATLIGGQDEPL
jgi:hypothetical protein